MGELIVKPKYDSLNILDDNIIIAQINNAYGIIDNDGHIKVPFEYDLIQPCYDNSSELKKLFFFKENKSYFIDSIKL